MTSESLWTLYRDEINDNENENDITNKRSINKNTIASKCFEYKAKTIRRTPDDKNKLHTQVVVLLKYLSNFCRSLDFSLINNEHWNLIFHGQKNV